jgi:hypothetical protein
VQRPQSTNLAQKAAAIFTAVALVAGPACAADVDAAVKSAICASTPTAKVGLHLVVGNIAYSCLLRMSNSRTNSMFFFCHMGDDSGANSILCYLTLKASSAGHMCLIMH